MQHGKTVGARSWPPAVQITDALAVRHFRLAVEETDLTRLVKQLEFLGLDAWTTKFGASSAALRWSNRIRLSPRSKPGSTVHSTSRPGRWNSLQEDVAGLIPTIIHFSVSFYLPLLIRFFPHAIRFSASFQCHSPFFLLLPCSSGHVSPTPCGCQGVHDPLA
jgi:hypothetical protein